MLFVSDGWCAAYYVLPNILPKITSAKMKAVALLGTKQLAECQDQHGCNLRTGNTFVTSCRRILCLVESIPRCCAGLKATLDAVFSLEQPAVCTHSGADEPHNHTYTSMYTAEQRHIVAVHAMQRCAVLHSKQYVPVHVATRNGSVLVCDYGSLSVQGETM